MPELAMPPLRDVITVESMMEAHANTLLVAATCDADLYVCMTRPALYSEWAVADRNLSCRGFGVCKGPSVCGPLGRCYWGPEESPDSRPQDAPHAARGGGRG